ncbi:MAG: oxygenase MpaB family protein, partial [Actinomycetota bacterium]|nr:oxygenase MpaB family protein [Actinomycetota bacterium]
MAPPIDLTAAVGGVTAPAAVLARRVRDTLGGELRAALGAPEPEEVRHVRRPGEPGLFAPDSVTWRVHADTSMLIGGLRALLLQTLHPLAMAGVAEHSDYRNDPWGRLRRTSQFVGATTYGGAAEAERAIETVIRVHERVRGVAPNGLPYRASDPHLITWVHATEVDSFLRTYQRYGHGTLTDAEADRYVAEMAVIGQRLGGSDVPTSRAELRVWLRGVRPELRAGAQARDGVRFL